MRSCWLIDNRSVAALLHSASVVFRDCLIERNEWDESGPAGGTLLVTDSTLELYDCTLRDNRWKAIRLDGAPRVVMDGCRVSGQKNNGACEFDNVGDLQIRNSTFVDNKSTGNGGALTILYSTGAIEFCVFAHDSAAYGGGGAATSGGIRMTDNTFYACQGPLGGAVAIDGLDVGFDRNIVASSSSADGAVIRYQGASGPITGCNIFWANSGGDFSSYGTWTPAPTDIFADPQFCDPLNDDLTLDSSSPGAPTGPCGQIGALGVACGSVSVESKSWGQIKGAFR
jgi:hypothetical protein